MNKYRLKPVLYEARTYTRENEDEMIEWMNQGRADGNPIAKMTFPSHTLRIKTPEGHVMAGYRDVILKQSSERYFVRRPADFALRYEMVED